MEELFFNVESIINVFSVVCGSIGKSKDVQKKQGNCFLSHNIETHVTVQYLVH